MKNKKITDNKQEFLNSLDRLRNYVSNNFENSSDWQSPLGTLWDNLDTALANTQAEHDDIFGTEGYEHNILGVMRK